MPPRVQAEGLTEYQWFRKLASAKRDDGYFFIRKGRRFFHRYSTGRIAEVFRLEPPTKAELQDAKLLAEIAAAEIPD